MTRVGFEPTYRSFVRPHCDYTSFAILNCLEAV